MFNLLTGSNPIPVSKKTLKVLAIGNSFSVNAMRYLYQIAEAADYSEIKLGNLYIAGCSLQTHWKNAGNNNAGYTYYTNYDGTWISKPYTSILSALTSEKWDYIIFQQASAVSGIPATFEPYLGNLVETVNASKTNPEAQFVWHMTWAYAKTSPHTGFTNYNNDQNTMYNAIVSTCKNTVMAEYGSVFKLLLPSGTAIQNMRSSYIDDEALTCDGHHLSQNLGCLTAGMTWFKALTGNPIDEINTDIVSENYLEIIKESVNNAVNRPYEVTKSSFITKPEFN